jgi:hypothetical protein
MARDLFWLSDEEWRRIEPHLPRGPRGAHRVDDRRVISGIIHMLRTGAPWRECPAEYGPYTTIYNRFHRWRKQGVWHDDFYAVSGVAKATPSVARVNLRRSAVGMSQEHGAEDRSKSTL